MVATAAVADFCAIPVPSAALSAGLGTREDRVDHRLGAPSLLDRHQLGARPGEIRSNGLELAQMHLGFVRFNPLTGRPEDGMRVLIWLLLLLMLAAVPGVARAECGYRQLTVEGTTGEITMACEALASVSHYFAGLGETDVPPLTVRFDESVELPGAPGLKLAGLFRGADEVVDVVRPSSTHFNRPLHWNQLWTPAVARSVLEHEFAHAFAYPIGGQHLDYAWNEFVAYAVQFSVMDSWLRARILITYPTAAPYPKAALVCDLSYLADVDLFAVRSYLTAEAKGGRSFIGAVLSGAYSTRPPRRFECPALHPADGASPRLGP
jgi:hypothetical protein